MKKNLHLIAILVAFGAFVSANSCQKGIKVPVTLDKAAGKWSINAIRMKVFYGTTLSKDSTVPWRPVVENYVTFDGVSALNYCFNSETSLPGQYQFINEDSIAMQIGDENKRWKIQLLTGTNFNIESTSENNTEFPGATVVTFKGFVR